MDVDREAVPVPRGDVDDVADCKTLWIQAMSDVTLQDSTAQGTLSSIAPCVDVAFGGESDDVISPAGCLDEVLALDCVQDDRGEL